MLYLIEGATGSGKTRYIKALGAKPENTLTSEGLWEHLLSIAKGILTVEETAARLRHIEYVENLESFLGGRQVTQALTGKLLTQMAKDRDIYATGIDFQKKFPFFLKALDNYERRTVALGQSVTVTVDRPFGSTHPDFPDLIYPVNYGFIKEFFAPDGEEQDAYILGVDTPVSEFTGTVIAIVHRLNDREDKWVVAPEGMTFSKKEIAAQVHFQEQYFDTVVIA